MDNNYLKIKTAHICRTCMDEITNTTVFNLDFTCDSEPTIGQKLSNCIPELDLSIVPNTVICGKCADTINSLYSFKEECLRLEMQIHEYIQQVQHTGSTIDLAAVMQFHQLHSKSLTAELKTEAFEKTENYKSEESSSAFCENYAFNETERYTEVVNRDYLTSLAKVDIDRECVLFNTIENFSNFGKSEVEENSDTHDDINIVQDSLLQVVENPESSTRNLNKTDIYYQCFTCGHKAERKLKLIRHLKSHRDNTLKLYQNKISSKSHKKLFKCLVCDYRCKWKSHLKSHMLTHTGEKPFKCSVCEYSCNHKNSLKSHMLTHTGEKPFKCSFCEYSFHNKSNLKSHILTHTGEKPFKCSVCEYSCIRKESLKSHMLNHTGEKPFKCSICESSFNDKSNLNSHILTHTREKPFKCSICKYSCNYKRKLKSHMLTHTGEPLKCSICEYTCKLKQSLKNHMLTHTGEKPFKCSVCEYTCKLKQSLKSHMLTHTGEKPFNCSFCEYCCARRNQLKLHMQNHS